MLIPLREFELHVRPEPLEKGLQLFEHQQVELMRNDGKGKVEAVVHDGEGAFHPALMIKGESVHQADCDCGQADGTICRHGIAVLFAMSMGDFKEGVVTRSGKMPVEKVPVKRIPAKEAKGKTPKEKPAKAPKPPKTVADILDIVPKEEVVAFLVDLCKSDKQLTLRIKSHFSDLLPVGTPAELAKRIEESFKAAGKPKGRLLKKQVEDIEKAAKHWLAEGIRFAGMEDFDMALAVLGDVIPRLPEWFNYSNFPYESAAAITVSLKLLNQRLIETTKGKPKAVSEFFRVCYDLTGRMFDEKEDFFLRTCTEICEEPADVALLEKYLAHLGQQPMSWAFGMHWRMIARMKGAKAADAFREKHKGTIYFGTLLIKENIEKRDFAAALEVVAEKMTKESIKAHKAYISPTYWLDLKETILKEKGDHAGRVLNFIEINNMPNTYYRRSLKPIADELNLEEWAKVREEVLKVLERAKDRVGIAELFHVKDDLKGFAEYTGRMEIMVLAEFASSLQYKYEYQQMTKLLPEQLMEKFEGMARAKSPLSKSNSTLFQRTMKGVLGYPGWGARIKALAKKYPDYNPIKDMIENLKGW